MAGMRNARVLPDPVRAAPRTSFPARRTGMDLACTGVMVVMPISARARWVGWERSRVEKEIRSVWEGAAGSVVVVVGVDSEGFDAFAAADDVEAEGSASCSSVSAESIVAFDFDFLDFFCFPSASPFDVDSVPAASAASTTSIGSFATCAEADSSIAAVVVFDFLCLLFFLLRFELEPDATAAVVDIVMCLFVLSRVGIKPAEV